MNRPYDDALVALDALGLRRWREWAVHAAQGCVLELGVGSGLNLPHYRTLDTLTAIDPDADSLKRAAGRVERSRGQLRFCAARAEGLPFADESFDVVVATLVFCSVDEPASALREARRVLKAGGAFRLVEHVRVENRLVAGAQDRLTPVWSRVAGGCHLNRDTLSAVKAAGWRVRRVYRLLGGAVIGIDAVNSRETGTSGAPEGIPRQWPADEGIS